MIGSTLSALDTVTYAQSLHASYQSPVTMIHVGFGYMVFLHSIEAMHKLFGYKHGSHAIQRRPPIDRMPHDAYSEPSEFDLADHLGGSIWVCAKTITILIETH